MGLPRLCWCDSGTGSLLCYGLGTGMWQVYESTPLADIAVNRHQSSISSLAACAHAVRVKVPRSTHNSCHSVHNSGSGARARAEGLGFSSLGRLLRVPSTWHACMHPRVCDSDSYGRNRLEGKWNNLGCLHSATVTHGRFRLQTQKPRSLPKTQVRK